PTRRYASGARLLVMFKAQPDQIVAAIVRGISVEMVNLTVSHSARQSLGRLAHATSQISCVSDLRGEAVWYFLPYPHAKKSSVFRLLGLPLLLRTRRRTLRRKDRSISPPIPDALGEGHPSCRVPATRGASPAATGRMLQSGE